jgi:hypothetical protein
MQGWVAMNLPIVGTGCKANICYKRKAPDRIFVLGKRPNGLVFLPELNGFIRRTFVTAVSQMKAEDFRWVLTR